MAGDGKTDACYLALRAQDGIPQHDFPGRQQHAPQNLRFSGTEALKQFKLAPDPSLDMGFPPRH